MSDAIASAIEFERMCLHCAIELVKIWLYVDKVAGDMMPLSLLYLIVNLLEGSEVAREALRDMREVCEPDSLQKIMSRCLIWKFRVCVSVLGQDE